MFLHLSLLANTLLVHLLWDTLWIYRITVTDVNRLVTGKLAFCRPRSVSSSQGHESVLLKDVREQGGLPSVHVSVFFHG